MLVFLASSFLENGSVAFFVIFFETFGFRHFGRLFCAFSYELKKHFYQHCFSMKVFVFVLGDMNFFNLTAFGKILLLVNAFFSSNSNLKSIEKLIFPAFGKVLVLVNAFFFTNSNLKRIEKLFFQLLARSWFWRAFFSIQILIEKVLKN